MIVVLDSGVLGSIANPRPQSDAVKAMKQWGFQMVSAGHTFAVPAICVYETRRELVRRGDAASVAALDAFCFTAPNLYLPISDFVLRRASELWAQIRNADQPPTKDSALDGDMILCAHVLTAGYEPRGYIVATTNTKHLTAFVAADEWHNIHH